MTVRADMAACIRPPRKGEVWSKVVDVTARAFDLRKLAFGGVPWDGENTRKGEMILVLEAYDADVYYQLAPDGTVTMDPTAAEAAATATPVFTNTYCPRVPAGAYRHYTLDRGRDLFLHVRTLAGTGRLDVFLTSDISPSASRAQYGA